MVKVVVVVVVGSSSVRVSSDDSVLGVSLS